MRKACIFSLLAAAALVGGAGGAEPNEDPFARWAPAIQAFEKADAEAFPPPDGVLFIGSSSIRMWKDLAKDFPEHRVIQRGFGGSQIADSVHFADRIVIPYRPRQIVMYAGDNDIAAGKSPDTVLADFKRFVEVTRKELPETRIAFIAIKPSVSRWHLADKIREANQKIEDYARTDDRLTYIDIFTPMLNDSGRPREDLLLDDGLHMNREGYRIWAERVREALH